MLINNRYQVIRALGEGGFGQAYLATDQQMPSQRKCAIKQLKPITTNPEAYQLVQSRFQREAAILEQLGEDHPQIPRLYAYFSENRQFYLVQEWIDGITLDTLVNQQGPLPEAVVRSILTALLPVLDFIHSQGIIHRDIKPDNVILRSRTQQPVLIDFGAVRETMQTVVDSQNRPKSSIAIGTPGFMPPEQAAGRPILSSDLYSLGLVAIYLLTGQLPQAFETDVHSGEIIWQVAAPHVSAGFVTVLEQSVKSHPRDRYSSAQAMLAALSALPTAPKAPSPLIIPANNSTANNLAVPQQYHPLAADSTLKTVVVAPAQRERTSDGSTLPRSEENSGKTVIAQVPRNRSSDGSSPNVFSNSTNYEDNVHSEQSRKRFSPLAIGMTLAVVLGSAIAATSLLNQSTNAPSQAIRSDAAPVKVSKQPAPKKETNSAQSETDNADADPLDSIEIGPETGSEATAPTAENAPPDGGQLTLGSSSGKPIPVFNDPSFSAQSAQSGASGDRVTILQQSQGDDGGTWYRVRFSSGAEGWVSGAYADSSGYASAPAGAPAAAPPAAPAPSPPTSLPPAQASSAQIAGGTGAQVDVYAAPSSDANSPHYGLGGDRIEILDSTQGEDGRTWYEVQFDSGASGWVSGDSVQTP